VAPKKKPLKPLDKKVLERAMRRVAEKPKPSKRKAKAVVKKKALEKALREKPVLLPKETRAVLEYYAKKGYTLTSGSGTMSDASAYTDSSTGLSYVASPASSASAVSYTISGSTIPVISATKVDWLEDELAPRTAGKRQNWKKVAEKRLALIKKLQARIEELESPEAKECEPF